MGKDIFLWKKLKKKIFIFMLMKKIFFRIISLRVESAFILPTK